MIGGITIRSFNPQGITHHKVTVATGIAILVHAVGLAGMVWIDRNWFSSFTPVNLLLMSALLIWTQADKTSRFYRFIAIAFTVGMLTEIIGVNTGLLFGSYSYGDTLGFGIAGVPLVIGMNWFVVMIAAASFLHRLLKRSPVNGVSKPGFLASYLSPLSFVALTSLLAVFFDWIMEPAAVTLGFWKWNGDGSIPMLNYICWFFISFFLVSILRRFQIRTDNTFAFHLFLIQGTFFLLIRIFLK
jgi:putative membrane protein